MAVEALTRLPLTMILSCELVKLSPLEATWRKFIKALSLLNNK